MEPTTIIMMVVIFVLMYMMYYYYISKNSMLMSGITSGKQTTIIDASKIDMGSSSTGVVNFTYAVWFNINDWNDNYGSIKPLFQKVNGTDYTINTYFAANQNDLIIKVLHSGVSPNNTTTCTIKNVPIQKWVHLLISVYGKSLDTYINGKLVNTCILNGVPLVDKGGAINITPGIGFNGWTAQFQYWADATDPQKAWNIYKKGNGNTIFSNMFGNYGLKIALMSDGEEANTISI